MEREVEDVTFRGDENEMTTESGNYKNHIVDSELIITSSISSLDNSIFSIGESNSHHQHSHSSNNMYFHSSFGDTFFLKTFTTSSHLETFYICLLLFFLAIIYNALKLYQYHLSKKRLSIEATCYPVAEKFSEADTPDNNTGSHHFKEWIKCIICAHNLIDTLIHMIQVTIGYLLMLAIMSFNVWILAAVILGEGIGYFIFGWMRRSPSTDAYQGDNPCFFLQPCSGNFNEKESK